jgi:hypothetical protein
MGMDWPVDAPLLVLAKVSNAIGSVMCLKKMLQKSLESSEYIGWIVVLKT